MTGFDLKKATMNQICKVCGEPAAGFHFGAFTCEGCKSFFGRSYNNTNTINDCKNNNKCLITKKNRTSCKACRLRKCITVGMSKSGSRYGRRSNWFKIHCLLQEKGQSQLLEDNINIDILNGGPGGIHVRRSPPPNNRVPPAQINYQALFQLPPRENLRLFGLEEPFRPTVSPAVSSPDSHQSDSSVEMADSRRMPLVSALLPTPAFIPHAGMFFAPGYGAFQPHLLPSPIIPNNNNNNAGAVVDTAVRRRRYYLDTVLQLQRTSPPTQPNESGRAVESPPVESAPVQIAHAPEQATPIDLSVKSAGSEKDRTTPHTIDAILSRSNSDSESSDSDSNSSRSYRYVLDLTNKE